MQNMMCVDDVELDPSIFQMQFSRVPFVTGQNQEDNSSNSIPPQTVAVVELGKRLLNAAKDGEVTVVRELMSKGAPFTTDWLGVSPLHLAVQNNHVETAEVLLRAGISQEARTKVDRTPLHMAAQNGHLESIKLLLRHGADVNCRDMLRMTPLHWAVENQSLEVIEALLQGGADPYAVSKFDKTPLSIANDMGRSDIVHILENTDVSNIVQASLETPNALDQESLAATESLAAELGTDHNEVTQQIQAGPPNPKKGPKVRIQMESKQVTVTIPPRLTSRSINSNLPTANRITTTSSGAAAAAASATTSAANNESESATINVKSETGSVSNSTFQLLQAHGITMLPDDESTTVESAVESGQTLELTEAGKMALNLTRGGRLLGYPKGKSLNNVTSGGVQKRAPILGNKSRIIKIHPSQLVALGGGRVQVPGQLVMQQAKGPNILKKMTISPNMSFGTAVKTVSVNPGNSVNRVQRIMIASPQQTQQIQQHFMQLKRKENVQQVQIQQVQPQIERDISDLEDEMVSAVEDYEEEENEEPPMPTDIETIAQELAAARKQAAEFRKQLAKKEREAEHYLQQLRSIKNIAQ